MGFRLNLKWSLCVQSPFSSSTNSSSSWPSSSYSSYKGRESFYDSTKISLSSFICGDTETMSGDPLRARSLSIASEMLENNFLGEEVQIDIGNGPNRSSKFCQLMKNLDVLEETLSDSHSVRMKREILTHLEKLGALELFHVCLSQTLKQNFLDLPDIITHISQDIKTTNPDPYPVPKVLVPSVKKERRNSRRKNLSNKSKSHSQSIFTDPQDLKILSTRISSKSRKFAKNEAELSRGVKLLAELERIKKIVEEESGKVVSSSRWAEAAGVENIVLQKRLHLGLYCRDQLLKSTRSLVLYIARNYRGLGVAFEDLIQAGNMGVLQGAERFDHTRGYKFSTYVHYWIRKSISMLVAKHARAIRVPTTLNNTINKIHRARKALHTSHGKIPDDNEIAKFTGLSIAKVTSASKCLRVVGSIDQKIGDCSGPRFLEFIPDMSIMNPKESVTRQHMINDIYDLLEGLEPREREVLMLRFGMGNHQCKSLEEIGRLFCVSKEWIRKIERTALNKLRNQDLLCNLRHYLYT